MILPSETTIQSGIIIWYFLQSIYKWKPLFLHSLCTYLKAVQCTLATAQKVKNWTVLSWDKWKNWNHCYLAVFDLLENKHSQSVPNVSNWELIGWDGLQVKLKQLVCIEIENPASKLFFPYSLGYSWCECNAGLRWPNLSDERL